jgi:hypothetical protein
MATTFFSVRIDEKNFDKIHNETKKKLKNTKQKDITRELVIEAYCKELRKYLDSISFTAGLEGFYEAIEGSRALYLKYKLERLYEELYYNNLTRETHEWFKQENCVKFQIDMIGDDYNKKSIFKDYDYESLPIDSLRELNFEIKEQLKKRITKRYKELMGDRFNPEYLQFKIIKSYGYERTLAGHYENPNKD